MGFFKRKKNRSTNQKVVFKRGISQKPLVYNPSWKSFKTNKRRNSLQKNPLISVKTPRLVISYFRLWVMKVTYKTLFILLFFGLFYMLFFSEWFQIQRVVIEGNKNTDKKLILDAVEPYLHKKVLSFFPSNNYFWISNSGIIKEVKADFRRISDVKIQKSFPGTLILKVEEKKAVLLFCNEKGCLWVDEDGYSYNQSSYSEAVSDSTEVVIVEDSSHSDLVVGQAITDSAYVSFANDLWHQFPEKTQKELSALSTPLPSAREIRATTKEGWTVYFDVDMGIERNMNLLVEVLKQIKDKEGEGKIPCLDYIDLRVQDRVFYKLKDNCGGENQQNNNGNNNSNTNTNTNNNNQLTDSNQNANKDNSLKTNSESNTNKSAKNKKKN